MAVFTVYPSHGFGNPLYYANIAKVARYANM